MFQKKNECKITDHQINSGEVKLVCNPTKSQFINVYDPIFPSNIVGFVGECRLQNHDDFANASMLKNPIDKRFGEPYSVDAKEWEKKFINFTASNKKIIRDLSPTIRVVMHNLEGKDKKIQANLKNNAKSLWREMIENGFTDEIFEDAPIDMELRCGCVLDDFEFKNAKELGIAFTKEEAQISELKTKITSNRDFIDTMNVQIKKLETDSDNISKQIDDVNDDATLDDAEKLRLNEELNGKLDEIIDSHKSTKDAINKAVNENENLDQEVRNIAQSIVDAEKSYDKRNNYVKVTTLKTDTRQKPSETSRIAFSTKFKLNNLWYPKTWIEQLLPIRTIIEREGKRIEEFEWLTESGFKDASIFNDSPRRDVKKYYIDTSGDRESRLACVPIKDGDQIDLTNKNSIKKFIEANANKKMEESNYYTCLFKDQVELPSSAITKEFDTSLKLIGKKTIRSDGTTVTKQVRGINGKLYDVSTKKIGETDQKFIPIDAAMAIEENSIYRDFGYVNPNDISIFSKRVGLQCNIAWAKYPDPYGIAKMVDDPKLNSKYNDIVKETEVGTQFNFKSLNKLRKTETETETLANVEIAIANTDPMLTESAVFKIQTPESSVKDLLNASKSELVDGKYIDPSKPSMVLDATLVDAGKKYAEKIASMHAAILTLGDVYEQQKQWYSNLLTNKIDAYQEKREKQLAKETVKEEKIKKRAEKEAQARAKRIAEYEKKMKKSAEEKATKPARTKKPKKEKEEKTEKMEKESSSTIASVIYKPEKRSGFTRIDRRSRR